MSNLYPWEATILLAATSGQTAKIQQQLENGVHVDTRDMEHGRTCLSWAVEQRYADAVHLLLRWKADPNVQDGLGRTPLLQAIENGNEDIVKQLLDAGASLELADFQGQSPLIVAAKEGFESLVNILLNAGANPDSRDWHYGGTPLSWSARKGYANIVQVLLDHNATVDAKDESNRTPLAWAARKGHAQIVKLLLSQDARTDVQDCDKNTAFESAFERGHDAIVQHLTGKSIQEINDNLASQSPAVKLENLRELFKRSVKPKFDLHNPEDGEVLVWAIQNNREEDALLLIEQGTDLNYRDEKGTTALSSASSCGLLDVVKSLLEANVNPDSVDQDGWTPLMAAAERGHSQVVRFLLEKQADVNWRSHDEMTPILCASGEAVAALLLDAGADPNDADMNCRTPITYAAENGDESLVLLLLERGALLDEGQECSPLMTAISQHNEAFVRLLLEKGADPYSDEYSCCEYPPIRYAADLNQLEITKLLLEKDAASADMKKDHILRAIDSACENNSNDMVDLLINQLSSGCKGDDGLKKELLELAENVFEQYGYDRLINWLNTSMKKLQLEPNEH
ncbi:uncharacterized protein N7529_001804 [Penicillium soppii]|uniref:uncharacterized protein n=1 Tax=Penicillium soppii TaxID=69789 RepID=UPI0025493244|nr:uncharacterized protein N7529_001804 [Penicillium soppii]KAJ5876220.1 hypothetical protein N7529_001804 [Penicillium soppii]